MFYYDYKILYSMTDAYVATQWMFLLKYYGIFGPKYGPPQTVFLILYDGIFGQKFVPTRSAFKAVIQAKKVRPNSWKQKR